MHHKNVLKYIADIYDEDIAIKSASSIIFQYGNTQIYNAYTYAKQHFNNKEPAMVKVSTIFTAKGSEADRVVLLDDVNMMIEKAITGKMEINKERESLRLAYVAYSRAKKELINATHLPHIL